MTIPVAYTLGLVVLLLARHVFLVLPGSGNPWLAAFGLLTMLVPAAMTHAATRVRSRRVGSLLLRMAPALLPSLYAVLLAPLGWLDMADTWSGGSPLALLGLLVLPLLAAELLRVFAEVRFIGHQEQLESTWPLLRPRIAFLAMFTLPWLVLAIAGELVEDRPLGVFLLGTNTGMTVGTLAFAVGVGVLLPLAFRYTMGLSRRLPEPVGTELRATAAALGFRGSTVFLLDSGLRSVNALMIGPLPWPRYLVLTDGLLAILDVQALRGVVAHEVGHAQAGHPALLLALFVVAPLLLSSVGQHFAPSADQLGWQIGGGAAALLFAWWALRRVSHRFEHEADVLSAIALGGADPCIRALTRVGEVVQGETAKATMLHPSERDRIEVLRRFAEEPEFRARFALRGLRLRRAILALMTIAFCVAGVGAYAAWPCERAAISFGSGRLRTAHEQALAVGSDVTAGQLEWWTQFREDLDAAYDIAGPVDASRDELRDRLAGEGWRRGVETLVARGGAAARPWMVLATEDRGRSPLRRCVRLYCEAAADSDIAMMEAVSSHLRGMDLPPELRNVFAQ